MRIKLDENLPVSLVDALCTHGHDVDTVADEALTGANDRVVWQVGSPLLLICTLKVPEGVCWIVAMFVPLLCRGKSGGNRQA